MSCYVHMIYENINCYLSVFFYINVRTFSNILFNIGSADLLAVRRTCHLHYDAEIRPYLHSKLKI